MFDSMPLVVKFITDMIESYKRKDPHCLKCGHLDIEHKEVQNYYFGLSSSGNRVCQYPSTSDPNQFEGQTCSCGELQLPDMRLARPHDPTYVRRARPLPSRYGSREEWR